VIAQWSVIDVSYGHCMLLLSVALHVDVCVSWDICALDF